MNNLPPQSSRAIAAVLLAIAGLAATLGAAACCALPRVFATLSIAGGAWLFDIAVVAGPWQRMLLWGGAAALAAALFVARARAAPADCLCARAGFRVPLLAIVMAGGALAGLVLAVG